MSEVLIRMKMPQCCEECRFFTWKRGVGQHCAVDDRITFHATLDGFDVGYERNGDCPLVPVPSNGRLIDADALFGMKECCRECLRREELYTRWERKPITNAARIRSMTDEEIAEMLAKETSYLPETILRWLKQDVSDGS